MKRPPFPSVLDSTIIAAFKACPQKAFLQYVMHWKSVTPNVHLHAGGAYARGLEVARKAFFQDEAPSNIAIAQGIGVLLHTMAAGKRNRPASDAAFGPAGH
jgi:hypothetical protein